MTESTEHESVRIGIDVGGTFTHAVALDASTLEILGRVKVPTTHTAAEGVAKGIIDALLQLIKEANVSPESIKFIAHSTTQATNALLEGDVAPVGILAIGKGSTGWLSKLSTNLGKIELAPQKYLHTYFKFMDTSRGVSEDETKKVLTDLVAAGAKAIAIAEAFAVDDPTDEQRVLEIAREMNLLATSSSEVSQLYGLKVRTRTAVINAAMLPKMIESADMTEKAVRDANITAPVMIMRSDGGVMDIAAMRKRPIMTMLSGPAAGVAAAMMFLHISDGVFLEVGGTSTDISAISNGRAQVRSGEIGGHKVYLRTLDVRTVGVAGGSLPRLKGSTIHDVGPRSAHIAGLKYVSFLKELKDPQVTFAKTGPTDPDDYLSISQKYCLTPTCAANLLGLVPAGDCAEGNKETINTAFEALAKTMGKTKEEAARIILEKAAEKCIPIVKQLMKDHKLDPRIVTLVGGGGGAAAIVPFVAKQMGLRHYMAEHADVISAIGVALALIRETIERQVIAPTNEDILKIRSDAFAAVLKMGADPSTVDVHIEVDARTNTLRATAFGATSMTKKDSTKKDLSPEERIALVAESMRLQSSEIRKTGATDNFELYEGDISNDQLFGLLKRKQQALRVLDKAGTMRLQIQNGRYRQVPVAESDTAINQLCEENAQWGDAGKVIPDIVILAGPKIIDLSGLANSEQMTTLAKAELEQLARNENLLVLANIKQG